MKNILWFSILIALAQAGTAQPLRFTLDDCLEYAMGNSYVREQMALSQRSAELDVEQSRLERLPNLTGSAGENLSHTRGERRTIGGSYGLNSGITLFQGGAINEGIKQSELQSGQAGVRAAQYDNTLAIDILGSYFTIVGYGELQRYQQALIAAGEEQVREGMVSFETETIIESDYLMFEAQLEQNRNSALQTEIDLRNELLNLKGLMSMPLEAELTLVGPDTTMVALPGESEFIARAESTLPDLEMLDYGVRIADNSLRIAKAGYFPSLSLSGGLSTRHADDFNNWSSQVGDNFSQSAGVSLSVPIFNRNRVRTSVAKSKIALQQAELDRLQGEIDVRRSLLRSYSDAVSARNDYSTQAVRENAYRLSLEASRAQYAAGTIKATELLQQENNYINVMYQFVQSKYDFMLRRRMLDVYMGENF